MEVESPRRIEPSRRLPVDLDRNLDSVAIEVELTGIRSRVEPGGDERSLVDAHEAYADARRS